MLRPPKTNDPALNRFLEEVASTIQDRVRPEEGWTLSDFASSVSEVISDKRDLIDIVTKYDSIEVLTGEMEAEIARLKSEIQDSIDLLSSIESKSAEFAEVMEWWDQNYKVIFDAQEAMEIFGEISDALEGHQDILDQITAATTVAEDVVTEVRAAEDSAKAAEAAAKTSETNAADAASAAQASETAAGESATAAGASATAAADDAAAAAGARDAAVSAADSAQGSATAAAADAGRAESAAAGVDQVVSDAASVLAGEIRDDVAAAQDAKSGAVAAKQGAEDARDQAGVYAQDANGSASTASNVAATVSSSIDAATALADRAETAALNAEASAAEASSVAGEAARTAAIHATAEEIQRLVGDAEVDLDTIYELASAVRENQDGLQALMQVIGNKAEGKFEFVAASASPTDTQPPNRVTFVMGPDWEPGQ